MNPLVQRATPEDAETILTIQHLAYREEAVRYNDFSLPPLMETLDDLRICFTDHTILKAVVDDRPVGSVRAIARDDTCHIGRLSVHPEYQHRGIGRALLLAVEAEFSLTARFELFTGASSTRNIALYERLGYSIFHSHPVNDRVTLVYLQKRTLRHKLGGG